MCEHNFHTCGALTEVSIIRQNQLEMLARPILGHPSYVEGLMSDV